MDEGFIVGSKGFSLREVDWLDKEGDCSKVCLNKREGCKFAQANVRKCAKNLIGHCCKHVICGSEEEKDMYKKTTGDKIIPSKIWKENQPVVENYNNISQEVISSAAVVGLSVFGKKVNAFCEGLDNYKGYCVYLSYEEPKKKDASAGELVGQEYGIVSMYLKNTELDTYWTLYNIYKKYKKKEKNVPKVMICPKVKDYYDGKGYSLELPKVDKAMAKGVQFYPREKEDNDFSIGVLRYFFFLEGADIKGFYEKVLKMYGNMGENAINNALEVKDKLKGLIIRNSITYRSKVARDYLDLVAGRPTTLDTVFLKDEDKKDYAMNFGYWLENIEENNEFINHYRVEQVEIEICCYYFKHMKEYYDNHVLRKNELDNIVNEINHDEKYVLSHSDFSAFSVVSSFFYYFMALCVFVSMYNRLPEETNEIVNSGKGLCKDILSHGRSSNVERDQDIGEVLKREIIECNEKHSKIKCIKNDSVKGWYEIFSSLFRMDEGRKRMMIRED